jgi:succinylglutamate desuccinylase
MRPGYANFQPIRRGEHLADDASGPVLAPEDGLILMPLYQSLGTDGFFLVQEVS